MNPYQEEVLRSWDYTVSAGDTLEDQWLLKDFEGGKYHLRVYGPNGFFREFIGDDRNPLITVVCNYEKDKLHPLKLSGNVIVTITNHSKQLQELQIKDISYKTGNKTLKVSANSKASLILDLTKSYNWYDFSVNSAGNTGFIERFAGRVENGTITKTDPLMGNIL